MRLVIDDIPLVGGAWVNRGGIMRWVEDAEPIKPIKPIWENTKRYDWYNLGRCGKCNAPAGEPCRSSGRTVPAHLIRLEAKMCRDCQTEIASARTYCDDCGTIRRRAQWREAQARKDERRRSAA